MTKNERKSYIKKYYAPFVYGNLEYLVDEIYKDFEDEIKSCNGCIYTSSSIDHFNKYVCDSCIRQKVEKYDNYKSKE